MRRLSLPCGLVAALLLAACTQELTTLTYDMSIDVEDEARRLELVLATEDVIARKFSLRPDLDNLVITTSPRRDGNGLLTVSGIQGSSEEEQARMLLEEQFTFEIKREIVPQQPKEGASETDAERMWEPTGITEKDLTWVKPVTQESTGAVGAELTFTETGLAKFQAILEEYPGAIIGIFVRDLLVSQLTIAQEEEVQDRILITSIPSFEIADIFSDDMNVGLHVRLTPR